MSISRKVIKGLGWTVSTSYLNLLISFGGNVLLARILSPSDFGTYALAGSIFSLVFMAAGFGSQEAIVQCREEGIPDLIPTAFWITAGLAFGLAITGMIVGFILGPFYGQEINVLVGLLCWNGFFSNLINAYSAILQRNLSYRLLSITGLVANLVSFGLACVLAWKGAGIGALLWRDLIFMAISFGGIVLFGRYQVPFRFNHLAARWVWKFGIQLLISRSIEILLDRLDKFLVGTFMGTAILGQYSLASRLLVLIHQVTYAPIYSIMFSALSSLQHQTEKLQYASEKMNYWLYRGVILLGLEVLFTSIDLVVLVYGTKWQMAGELVTFMCLAAILLPLNDALRILLIATGKAASVTKARFIQLAFFIPVIALASYLQNVVVVAVMVNLALLLYWGISARTTSSYIHLNWFYLLRGPLIATAVTILSVEIITNFVLPISDLLIGLIFRAILTAVVYAVALFTLERYSLIEEITNLKHLTRSGKLA